MRCRLSLAILSICLAVNVAQAGPWLRDEGSGFTSLSYSGTYFLDTAQANYLEYAWRDDLTLGADISFYTDRYGAPSGEATLFFRRPLSDSESVHRFAYELGLGARWSQFALLPHLKTGLSWGRGLTLGERHGWSNIDAAILWDLVEKSHRIKLDSTIGLSFNARFTGMMQLYLTHENTRSYAKLAPALVVALGKGKTRLQIGAEIPLRNRYDTALKLALWRDF
ncbi:hypothetical protein ACFSUD_13190 [Sulfitobacter aestuarii]|uniref:Cellulose biosynthesis protein BcsS n=1 Tax=Sulfitobacter aestuarii TaxID=2161676 RepID=A0ABW5U3R3_9RHOB